MGSTLHRSLHRRPRPSGGLVAVSLVTAAGLLCSTALAAPSWAAGSNGEASKSATAILADAKRATEAARTARVVGSLRQQGTAIAFNVVVGHQQGGGVLTDDGATFNVVLHQSKVYLKAGKATWTKLASATAANLLADRWLQTTTANQDFSDLAKFADIGQLTKQLSSLSGKLVKKGTPAFGGKPAIALVDSAAGGTLYVASHGTPYILGLAGSKANPGTVHFSQYNSAKVPQAPKGALNLDQLEGGAGASSGTSTTTSGA